MEENLVGYLLKGLDQSTHRQVEAYLESDAEGRERLEMFRLALAPLAADRDQPSPRPDLVLRTLARVAENVCRDLPRSPRPVSQAAPVSRTLWRRADLLVAACLLFAVLGVGIPAVSQLRSHRDKIECQNNLRMFHDALKVYHAQHGNLPKLVNQAPHTVAGLIAPVLNDAGCLPRTASVRCPARGEPVFVTLTVAQIKDLSPEQFQQQAPLLLPSYAYSLGYMEQGFFHFPDTPEYNLAGLAPLMADRPPHGLEGNSPNHGGFGQNVLFHDGHVRYVTQRTVGINGDDIYLNIEMKIAPGIGRFDAVLGQSASPFGAVSP